MSDAREQFLTPNQIAETLGVTPTVVRWWIRQDKLKAVKFGRQWLVSREDAESFFDAYQKWARPDTETE